MTATAVTALCFEPASLLSASIRHRCRALLQEALSASTYCRAAKKKSRGCSRQGQGEARFATDFGNRTRPAFLTR